MTPPTRSDADTILPQERPTLTEEAVRAPSDVAVAITTAAPAPRPRNLKQAITNALQPTVQTDVRHSPFPYLGDSRSTWCVRLRELGIDRFPVTTSIEVFSYRGTPIAVLFEHDRAVAIRWPYDLYQLRPLLCPTRSAAERVDAVFPLHILLADSGWIVATEKCERSDLLRLAAA
jgi:hypothetical protein